MSNILVPVDVEFEASWRLALPEAMSAAKRTGSVIHLLSVLPDFGMNALNDWVGGLTGLPPLASASMRRLDMDLRALVDYLVLRLAALLAAVAASPQESGYHDEMAAKIEAKREEIRRHTEWLDFVQASPDFELRDRVAGTASGGDEVAVSGPFGCWTGHPVTAEVPFRWSDGSVTVAFADDHAVTAALLVATALDATVFDDAGNVYEAPEPAWQFPDADEPRPEPVAMEAPAFDTPPERDELAFDFDGGPTFWDRVLARFGRRRG